MLLVMFHQYLLCTLSLLKQKLNTIMKSLGNRTVVTTGDAVSGFVVQVFSNLSVGDIDLFFCVYYTFKKIMG